MLRQSKVSKFLNNSITATAYVFFLGSTLISGTVLTQNGYKFHSPTLIKGKVYFFLFYFFLVYFFLVLLKTLPSLGIQLVRYWHERVPSISKFTKTIRRYANLKRKFSLLVGIINRKC